MALTLEADDGWDTELVPGTRPRAYKAIDAKLIKPGLVAYCRGNVYMFLGGSNSWAVLASPEAQKQLCDITGSDNVSVNYLDASIPYLPYLQMHAKRTSALPVSICIGTRRFSITINEDTLILSDCSNIASVSENFDARISGFCVMPCRFNEIPRMWTNGTPGRLFRYLLPLFSDPVEFETIMWVIGNAAIDPGSFSKFMLLYGPGGTGKSKVLSAIEGAMDGCSGTIRPGQLIETKPDININTAKTLVSNRIITAGDVNLVDGKLNLHTIKEMTGHDSIVIPPMRVATRCSVVASSNNLPDPLEQTEWTSTAISRRMVVIVMNVRAASLPPKEKPDNVEDNLDFLMHCVYLRLTKFNMPVSTRCLLYTLLGAMYHKVSEDIVVDTDATIQEIFDANVYLDIELSTFTYIRRTC